MEAARTAVTVPTLANAIQSDGTQITQVALPSYKTLFTTNETLTFTIVAVNICGYSPAASISIPIPGLITNVNVYDNQTGTETLAIDWNAAPDAISYLINYQISGNANTVPVPAQSIDGISTTSTSIAQYKSVFPSDTTVTFSVQAFNIAGPGPQYSQDFVVWKIPGGPTAGTLTVGALVTSPPPETQSLHIAWSGGVVPASYTVTWATVDNQTQQSGLVYDYIYQSYVDIDGVTDLSIMKGLSSRTVQFSVYAVDANQQMIGSVFTIPTTYLTQP